MNALQRVVSCFILFTLFIRTSFALTIDYSPEPQPVEEAIQSVFSNSYNQVLPADQKILADTGVPPENDIQAPSPQHAFVSCRWVSEIQDTLMCVFNYFQFTNYALIRACVYAERGEAFIKNDTIWTSKGCPIVSSLSILKSTLYTGVVRGHDLQGKDLLSFWNEFDEVKEKTVSPTEEEEKAKLSIETEFRQFLEPIIKERPNTVLITAGMNASPTLILSHELTHALFFNEPKYKELIQQYWETYVSEEDKKFVSEKLDRSGIYATAENKLQLINEFQAYMMTGAAGFGPFGPILKKHFTALRYFLITHSDGYKLINFPKIVVEATSELCEDFLLLGTKKKIKP